MYLLKYGLRELQMSAPTAAPWRPGIQIISVSPNAFRTQKEKKKKGGKNYIDYNENVNYFHTTAVCFLKIAQPL